MEPNSSRSPNAGSLAIPHGSGKQSLIFPLPVINIHGL